MGLAGDACLLPKPAHVLGDCRITLPLGRGLPDLSEQPRAGEDNARVRREVGEKVELPGREVDEPVANPYLASFQVDLESVERQNLAVLADPSSPQQGRDSCEQ